MQVMRTRIAKSAVRGRIVVPAVPLAMDEKQ
jgi:hypothetical protein